MQFLFPCHFSHLERDFSSFIMKPIDEKIETSRTNHNAGDHENLPWSLSITNIPYSVFDDENTKKMFENLFSPYGGENDRSFIYLKTFRRVRVTFSSEENAKAAQRDLHGQLFNGCELGVFFVQRRFSLNNNSSLMPPPPTKQFLISPPASPPVGWEQTLESHPVIDYDLLAAVATLDTSRPYEFHRSVEDTPSIVVHLCDEDNESCNEDRVSEFHPLKALPREVTQTRRPDSKLE